MRKGSIGLCVATLFARCADGSARNGELATFADPEEAWNATQQQLAWYRQMESTGQMVQISDRAELDRHVAHWQNGAASDAPIGYILSLETRRR